MSEIGEMAHDVMTSGSHDEPLQVDRLCTGLALVMLEGYKNSASALIEQGQEDSSARYASSLIFQAVSGILEDVVDTIGVGRRVESDIREVLSAIDTWQSGDFRTFGDWTLQNPWYHHRQNMRHGYQEVHS